MVKTTSRSSCENEQNIFIQRSAFNIQLNSIKIEGYWVTTQHGTASTVTTRMPDQVENQLSPNLQTPSRRAWEREDRSKPLTWKKEPKGALDTDSQTFPRCPALLSGQVGSGTGEGGTLFAWGQGWSSFSAKLLAQKRYKRADVHRSQLGPCPWEQKLLGLSVPLLPLNRARHAWPGARCFSMAPAPEAGRSSHTWAASHFTPSLPTASPE